MADQPFEIIPNPYSNQLEARWVFFDSKSGGGIHMRGALLHIENKTGRVLRVPKPGLIGSDVWINVKAFQPPSSGSMFVPQAAMLPAERNSLFLIRETGIAR
jgi:hypothetical protein